jgi:hypothetical protein
MKYFPGFLLLIGLTCFSFASAQTLRKVNNDAFIRGEKLQFRVFYDALLTGKVTAGYATLEVKNEVKTMQNRPVFHIVGEGKSRTAFNWFFKVQDRMESFIDEEALMPYMFIRRTREGGYVKDDDVRFDHQRKYASSRNAMKKIPAYIQDVVSAVYYARTIDIGTPKIGQNFSVDFFLDDSVYVSVIQYYGKEIITTKAGKFRCLKFKPMVATGKVFSNPFPMTLWISDDKNRLPILAESAVTVGKVKAELTDFTGLANPLESKLD